jgi:hypothetical protein
MSQQFLPRLASTLGMCALCLGATSGSSCSFFGISGDAEVTVDLSSAAPADRAIVQLVASVRGLEFQKSDGSTEELLFRDTEAVDFMSLDGTSPLRMFTDEELPEGEYTGVRLLLDMDDAEDAFVTLDSGEDFDLLPSAGGYAAIDFSVDDDSEDASLTLTLDMRLSLSFDDLDDEFTLTPYLRSAPSDDAGQIAGSVAANCPSGTSLADAAVYLFEGDVEPDDRDNSGVEPYATAPVVSSQLGTQFGYVFRSVAEGDYTIALTCRGDEEDALLDDDLDFQNAADVQLDRDQNLTHDIG